MRVDLVDLHVRVGSRPLIEGLDLEIPAGRFTGLVGPNGSGKSTLLKTVARILRADAGAVVLDGTDLGRMSARDVARAMAMVAQETPGEVELTVFEMVMLGRMPHQAALASSSAVDRDIAEDAMARVGIAHLGSRSWATLSGGEKQRGLLARALTQQTPVLLLDEPTNHLDIRHQLDLLALARDQGATTVAALHDLNLAARYCDEVIVLHEGDVVAYGPAHQVLDDRTLAPVFGVHVDRVTHPRTGEVQLLFSPLDAAVASLPTRGPEPLTTHEVP